MRKKVTVIVAGMAVLLLGFVAQAGVSLVVNGSFENDLYINDITQDVPYAWVDVNIPQGKFGGYVGDDWNSDGDYSLTLYVSDVATEVGDKAMVSQQVYLTDATADVNYINFDIKLCSTLSFFPWEPNMRSALVLIDDVVVWDSNTLGESPTGDGQYLDQQIELDGYDTGPHKLTLAIRINEDIPSPVVAYHAKWDFLRFDAHCEGYGYLPEDFDHSCYIDMGDLVILAGRWLNESPGGKYDLYRDENDAVDFYDIAVLAGKWMDTSYGQQDQLLEEDFNRDGIVNFVDFAILVKDWYFEPGDYEDISRLSEQWLEKNWLYGLD